MLGGLGEGKLRAGDGQWQLGGTAVICELDPESDECLGSKRKE